MELKILRTIADKALPVVKPIIFQLRKHSPEILTGTGAVAIVGGTVLACVNTKTAVETLNSSPLTWYEEEELEEQGVPEEERTEIRKSAMQKKVMLVVRSYIPSGGLVLGGVAMMAAAKSIEHRRFTAMLGAYSTLQSMFDEYRGRVIAEGGPSMDYRCMNGTETVKVEIEEQPEEGSKKKPKKTKEEVVVFTRGEDPYHRIFDECNCPSTWRENMENNRFFLECQQTVLNRELKATGRIFLNDVYKRLGFDYCEVGQFVGWLAEDIEGSKDGFIDFGIDYGALREEVERAQLENRRPEPSMWLNFNCDGEVWDKPLVKKYDI